MALCGTEVSTSTAFHPQTQGLTERANSTIIYSLKHYLHSLYETWDDHLIAVEFANNTSTHPTLGITPFEALYGFNPRSPLTLDAHTHLNTSKSAKYLEVIRSRVAAASDHIIQIQIKHAEALNKKCTHHSYAAGQQVWLSTTNLNLPYPKKFKPSYLGPFPITHMSPHSNSATLELPKFLSSIHPTFNVSLLQTLPRQRPFSLSPCPRTPRPLFL